MSTPFQPSPDPPPPALPSESQRRHLEHCAAIDAAMDRREQQHTVYAHVERTVHALLDAITANIPAAISPEDPDGVTPGVTPDGIKMLAEAVQALSSWGQPASEMRK